MKKFFVVVAVLALTLVSSLAMAQATVDGSIEYLMRAFKNTNDWNDATTGAGDYHSTYTRIRLGVNAKHEGVKGRFQIDTDWDQWADSPTGLTTGITTTASPSPGFEGRGNTVFALREAWVDFNIPGAGAAHIKVGRQLLQLGNGWFFRSNKYGSDAWLVGLPGKNTIAFVNVKASENDSTRADDTDAYVLLDNFKIDDTKTVGAYYAKAYDRKGHMTRNALLPGSAIPTNTNNAQMVATDVYEMALNTIGLWFNGTVGPLKLMAQFDTQNGKMKRGAGDVKIAGSQIVLQGTMPMDALTLKATLASGSGDKHTFGAAATPGSGSDAKVERFVPFLDRDPRGTFVYEYLMRTAAQTMGGNNAYNDKNTAFSNTQAISVGAMYKINKMISLGLDIWMLSANEKVALNGGVAPSDKLGTEFDISVPITITDQLTWNTGIGLFKTGDAYKNAAGKADDVTAVQSILSYKF